MNSLSSLAIWVSRSVYRSAQQRDLTFPYLLWLTQVGTFWSPVSYDYKLLFLPLAMLAMWDVRDRWHIHVLLLPFLVYWQPMRIASMGPWPLMAIKVAGLIGVGVLLVERSRYLSSPR